MSTSTSPILDDALSVVADYLDATARTTHERLGDVAGVAVTVGHAPEAFTVGASTEVAARVDRTQLDLGVGPCLDTLRSGVGAYVPDLATDARWGDYGPAAAREGAASCQSVPVQFEGSTVAVFKVYAAERDGLSGDQRDLARQIGLELNGGVAVARHLERVATELDDMTAMTVHRRVIDLALGIMMERAQVDAATAFGLLRTRSQQGNTKLRDVAQAVIASVPAAGAGDLVPPYDPHGW